jgi:pyruvate dehydrogenase E2 component (dihydrolipoamide acetyltransferase)
MAADVTIPRLGWSMEEGVFAGWLKKPGDTVKPGEPLFMLEGEKATQEIEAVDGGVLHLAPDAPSVGQTVLVGRTIGKLGAAGETPMWDAAAAAVAPAAPPAAHAPPVAKPSAPLAQPAGAPDPANGNGRHAAPQSIPAAASPSVRRLARQMGIDLATVASRLPGGRLSVEDLAAARHADEPAGRATSRSSLSSTLPLSSRSSPRARRAAQDRGLDVAAIRGSGAGGRVRERDVLAAAASGPASRGNVAPVTPPPGATAVPITQTRRTIARQMVRSRQETVSVTLTAWADATALLAARAALKAAAGPEAPTLNDMLLKALADMLLVHPLLAARWEDAHLALPGDRIDIGLAVDAAGGLVVPVVRDVAASPLAEVAHQTRWLVERARSGRLTAADMQGGVFTLTSLGSYGIEFFTPVINHPEAAILGVGAIRMQPVPPPGGQEGFILQRQLPLSLTFDHRIVDGGPAARFLGDLAARIAAGDATSPPASA